MTPGQGLPFSHLLSLQLCTVKSGSPHRDSWILDISGLFLRHGLLSELRLQLVSCDYFLYPSLQHDAER